MRRWWWVLALVLVAGGAATVVMSVRLAADPDVKLIWHVDDLSCIGPTPTPPVPLLPDRAVRRIAYEDALVQELVRGKAPGVDYWVLTDPGADGAVWLIVAFREPLAYAGPIPQRISACSGIGEEGQDLSNHPCSATPDAYITVETDATNVREVHLLVDPTKGRIVDAFLTDTSDDTFADMLPWFSGDVDLSVPPQ